MSIEIILLALSPIFLLFVGVEFIKFRRCYDIKDSLANALLALLHQGADAIALLLLMPFFYWLYQFRLFDIELTVFTVLGAFFTARLFILLVSSCITPYSLVMGRSCSAS